MVSKQITKCTRKKLIWCSEHSFKIVIWGAKTHLKALTEEKLLEKNPDKNLPVRYLVFWAEFKIEKTNIGEIYFYETEI